MVSSTIRGSKKKYFLLVAFKLSPYSKNVGFFFSNLEGFIHYLFEKGGRFAIYWFIFLTSTIVEAGPGRSQVSGTLMCDNAPRA